MLEGKVILVTGSGGGIGREIALLAANKGAKIVVNDLGSSVIGEGRSAGPAEETCKMIRETGGEAVASLDGVAEWKSAHRIVETALDSFGRLDVVVNNAGNVRWKPFWEIEEEEYRSIVSTHLDGTFFISRAAAPHFHQRKSGAFVHMTSTSGLMGHYNQAHYCAAKLGIAGLSKAIALEMKPFGVRSNCIAPFAFSRMAGGVVRTPEHKAIVDKYKPIQNAQLAVALASDGASAVSGQIFIVRGNEIFLAGQGFPVRGYADEQGWTPESILKKALPALQKDFTPVIGFNEYFSWLPV